MKNTVFVKRYPSKGELPEEGWVLTPSGGWLFHGGKFRCPHDGTIQQAINEWLEEIELPNEDDINEACCHPLRTYELGFEKGVDFILNKLK